ncbi:unnamed protein product [Sphagnum jensenii]
MGNDAKDRVLTLKIVPSEMPVQPCPRSHPHSSLEDFPFSLPSPKLLAEVLTHGMADSWQKYLYEEHKAFAVGPLTIWDVR